MSAVSSPTLKRVLAGDLCSGCGLCAGVSGGAITIGESPKGYNRPFQHAPISAEAEQAIARGCPGSAVAAWNGGADCDPYWGPHRSISTGHTTDGLFLDLWRAERTLLGDPVTEEFRARTGFTASGKADIVQYYEHLALIYLPHEIPERQVQALDLGRQALAQAQEAGPSIALRRALERTVCSPGTSGTCLSVVSSGHTLRDPFLTYWQEGSAADRVSGAHVSADVFRLLGVGAATGRVFSGEDELAGRTDSE